MSAKDRLTAGLNTAAVDDENNWEDDDSGSSASGSGSGGNAARNPLHQGGRLDNRQQGGSIGSLSLLYFITFDGKV